MTIINSIREVVQLPAQGFGNASQPVLGYNYGAKEYKRVLSAIRFVTLLCFGTMFIIWVLITAFPQYFIKIFTHDPHITKHAIIYIRLNHHLHRVGFLNQKSTILSSFRRKYVSVFK